MNTPIHMTRWGIRLATPAATQDMQAWIDGHSPLPSFQPCPPAPPLIDEMPAALRRRTTRLTRYVARVFYDIVPPDAQPIIPIIYVSANGELAVLEKLLDALYTDSSLSPMDFCNSVHHTATGYLSIAAANHEISRTISAGNRGFAAGLLEIWCLLQQPDIPQAVLITADEAQGASIGDDAWADAIAPYATALLFERHSGVGGIDAHTIRSNFRHHMSVFTFLKTHTEAIGPLR